MATVERITIPLDLTEEQAMQFDDALLRLGRSGLCDRIERLLVHATEDNRVTIERYKPLHALSKHAR